ncbi:MAG: methyltransferase [Solirubrobacteraceae bacterium]
MSAAYAAQLVVEPGVEIGRERIEVRFADGRREDLRLHDYERIYALPGLYERIVQERLGCRSPAVLAGMLGAAVDSCGWDRAAVRVLDIAAGNGVSGEALAAEGLGGAGRYGTDIIPVARAAALRDRSGVYDDYLTLDLLALSDEQRRDLAALGCAALSCVAPVGERRSELPPDALAAAATLLADDAVVVYMHDPAGRPDIVDARWWRRAVSAEAMLVARERYRHRYLADGSPFEMDGVVWRLQRAA